MAYQLYFFQKDWDVIGNGVLKTCLIVLNKQGTVASLSNAYITLISKTTKPRKTIEFRSISIYNVIYRIIAKATVNRLK